MASACHAAQSAGARRILLVSAHSGAGKTNLARCILRHANVVTDEPFQVQPFGTPWLPPEDARGYVWIDGLALLEGEGAAALKPSIRASFDAVLLVARGMVTTRAQVADCADQLRTLGMHVLGGVWNEFECPPRAETLRIVKAGLRKWPPRFPPGVFNQQVRRSS